MKILILSTLLLISSMALLGTEINNATPTMTEAEISQIDQLIERLPITEKPPAHNNYLLNFFARIPQDQWMAYLGAVDIVLDREKVTPETYHDFLLLTEYFKNPEVAKEIFIRTHPMMTIRMKYLPWDLALALKLCFLDGKVMSIKAACRP